MLEKCWKAKHAIKIPSFARKVIIIAEPNWPGDAGMVWLIRKTSPNLPEV
jgi:hypothetical protein